MLHAAHLATIVSVDTTPVPTLPPEGPTFAAPWQAQAFALVVGLAESGVFTWPEWVQAFAAEPGPDADYWQRWVAAAEKLVVARGLTSFDQLAARRFGLAATGPVHRLR
jgi:nitrile hydratase accessory protein